MVAANFKVILTRLFICSRPFPMILSPLMRLSGQSRSQDLEAAKGGNKQRLLRVEARITLTKSQLFSQVAAKDSFRVAVTRPRSQTYNDHTPESPIPAVPGDKW